MRVLAIQSKPTRDKLFFLPFPDGISQTRRDEKILKSPKDSFKIKIKYFEYILGRVFILRKHKFHSSLKNSCQNFEIKIILLATIKSKISVDHTATN